MEITEQLFEEWIKNHGEMVYHQIRRMVFNHTDADDIYQNTLLNAWKYKGNFSAKSKPSTWLFKIAYNESLKFIEKRKKLSVVGEMGEIESKSDEYFDGDSAQLLLQKAIQNLPDKQRMVFNLKYFDEMGYEEMELVTSTSQGALKASYHHACKKIKEYVQQNA